MERETVIVRNSGDNYITVSTNEEPVISRLRKHKVKPYNKQGEYVQYRLDKRCFRYLSSGIAIKFTYEGAK